MIDQIGGLLAAADLAQAAAWVAALVAAAFLVWRGWPAIRRTVNALHRSVELVDTLATLPEDLRGIRAELTANGGQSVKDVVNRTEKNVAALAGEVAHVKRQAASLKTSIAKTNKKLDAHISGQGEKDG
jgi:hypothetical protein